MIKTKSFEVGSTFFCSYCGCGMKYHEDIDYHKNIDDSYYYCLCWSAKLEEDMNEEIREVRKKYEQELQVESDRESGSV